MIDSKQIIPFNAEDVYEIVSQIPVGKVTTYGEIARLIGRPRNARQVGYTLKNVDPVRNIPCHRVVNSKGRIALGWAQQRELLQGEGVNIRSNGCVDMKRFGWNLF